ncbi:SDR family oxidoreductase [Reichenbachiella carrageenanivorans]|uniref:SDR family oxidoreductase n=1 Tax=Reichenbachiella carrageenanivorans TaxID=2979869 RepID=A0ABY6D2C6_9BACT|nr:SDR family oxidoreductase [Reichenbachiella carrageenanivorans]UXX79894.1 SDR family oxidoreductase [Reichenbachiella carrageenanivorans]
MFEIKGERVLVTGGSRGIGLSYVEALAGQGCTVVFSHYKDTDKATAECERLNAASKAEIHHIESDIADPVQTEALVKEAVRIMGGIDIMISNGGICKFTEFLDISIDSWKRHMDVNMNGPFMVTQLAAKQMIKQGNGGRIIFTTSVGAYRSNAGQTHYCASKAGLSLLSMGMAIELGEYNITVNSIAPGWIHTDINDKESRDLESVTPWIESKLAVGRLGKPKDLESAVLFLASKQAEYTTGSTIFVDGGWNAQL